MANDSTARILTIIGLAFNGLSFALSVLSLVLIIPLLALFASDPLTGNFLMLLWAPIVIGVLLALIIGLALPAIAYTRIRPESKGTAAAILIASGIIGLILVSLIGGILVVIAGILVATWQPFAAGGYRPIPDKSLAPPPSFAAQPSIAPTAKLQTPKGAQYCVACGTQLQGDERFCPVCGATVG
jgi:MFS family permease